MAIAARAPPGSGPPAPGPRGVFRAAWPTGQAAAGPATWFVPETDYVASWAPFSNVPTQLHISIDGVQRGYGQ